MENIILGNIISFIGSIFLFASCLAKTRRRVHFFQLIQCTVLAVAQLVFGSGAGVVSMAVAAIRNLLICFGIYGFLPMIVLVSFTVVFGTALNTSGLIGFLPVAAGVFYSIVSYSAKSIRMLKSGLAVLLFIWVIYSALILDVFGMLSNTSALVLDLVAIYKQVRKDKNKI